MCMYVHIMIRAHHKQIVYIITTLHNYRDIWQFQVHTRPITVLHYKGWNNKPADQARNNIMSNAVSLGNQGILILVQNAGS